jgi:hypothetical protein
MLLVALQIWQLMVRGQTSSDFHGLTSTLDDNKTKIAKSGALVPLTRLARSKDMRVQRNATGALLNMTHSGQKTLNLCTLCGEILNNICSR